MGGEARKDEKLAAAADREIFGDRHESGALMPLHVDAGWRAVKLHHSHEVTAVRGEHLTELMTRRVYSGAVSGAEEHHDLSWITVGRKLEKNDTS